MLNGGEAWRNFPPQKKGATVVGGFTNPFEKYERQNGNLPQTEVKIKNTLAGQKLCLLTRPTAKPFPRRILLST